MSTPQNTIAIVYDYDQTLSPSYMQDEVVFPAFGIDGGKFWTRCSELVRDHGYDNELAYMKVLLDTLGMDRPNKWSRKSPTALSSSASLQSTPVPSARRSTDW
jgi:hypothetical protein